MKNYIEKKKSFQRQKQIQQKGMDSLSLHFIFRKIRQKNIKTGSL